MNNAQDSKTQGKISNKNYLEDQNNGRKFKNIDECLNNKMNDVYTSTENLSIRSILEGKTPPKRRRMSRKIPTINILLNRSLGKAKPVMITALLDSGSTESLLNEKVAKNLRIRKNSHKTWSTAAGTFDTRGKTKAQFKMPELREQTIIEWDVHVTPNNMSYDMIIGRDLLSTLGIIIDFDNQMIEWQGTRIPM